MSEAVSTRTRAAHGPAAEVERFREYLGKHPYDPSITASSYDRGHDEQYFRLTMLGTWLSTTVRIVAGGTDLTPKQRLARLLTAQEQYETAYKEITDLFGAWLPAGS